VLTVTFALIASSSVFGICRGTAPWRKCSGLTQEPVYQTWYRQYELVNQYPVPLLSRHSLSCYPQISRAALRKIVMSVGTDQMPGDMSQSSVSRCCKVCDQIGTSDARWFIRTEEDSKPGLAIYIHHPDLRSLRASALKGCCLCEFILSTIVNSDCAKHIPTVDGDIVENSEQSRRTGKKAAKRKRLLQKHSHQLSSAIACKSLAVLERTGEIKDLHLLSTLCGHGRVVLIGTVYPGCLPWDLRAVVLYPFGAIEIADIHTLFIMGKRFDLAPDIGMIKIIPLCFVVWLIF
jgi:hypothetical protein